VVSFAGGGEERLELLETSIRWEPRRTPAADVAGWFGRVVEQFRGAKGDLETLQVEQVPVEKEPGVYRLVFRCKGLPGADTSRAVEFGWGG